MKKGYITPEISLCIFSAEDIITASGMTTAKDSVSEQLGTEKTVVVNWDSIKE